jgi:diguanylate cyclase
MASLDSFEKVEGICGAAMESMARHAIPRNPMNFTVWYEYHSGTNPQLTRTIDILVSNKTQFTDERNIELYATHFGLDKQADQVRQAGTRLQAAIQRVLQHVAEGEANTKTYRDQLVGYTEQLAIGNSSDVVAALVTSLLIDTKEIIEKTTRIERQFSRAAQETAELKAHLAATQREAVTDALTGVANRKLFDAQLREDVKLAMEQGQELCLLFADIDHFKAFNDAYGHTLGDEVLRLVGRTLRDTVRTTDTPCRYGGEEFAVILPQTSLTEAVSVAENLRQSLAKRTLRNRQSGKTYEPVTISIGLARYELGEPIQDFVERADAALYRAKREGRNRVAVQPIAARTTAPAA